MTTGTNIRLKPKERIVSAAMRLFYENDVHSIGVDRISREAEVSKRTLYKYFETKEQLSAHCLDTQANMWLEEYKHANEAEPAENILHIFEELEQKTLEKGFTGCPFMNAAIELRGTQQLGGQVAKNAKDMMLQYFERQTEILNLQDPHIRAEQLVILFDGSNAWFLVHGTFPVSTYAQVRHILEQS